MGITLSSRSPAMAYADGGMWVSTFDEIGQRCWVHTVTGQRTYKFIDGKPVASSALPSPHAAQSPSTSTAQSPSTSTPQSPCPVQSPYAMQSPYAIQSPYAVQPPYAMQSPFATQSPSATQQSPMPNQHIAPWAQSSSSPVPLPAPTYPAPPAPAGAHDDDGSGDAIVSYIPPPGYETGAPPVTPTGDGLAQRMKKYYLRSSTERSWMWRQ